MTAMDWVQSGRYRDVALIAAENLALCSKWNDESTSYKGNKMTDMINWYSVLRAGTLWLFQRLTELRIRA